jgi:radical SAM protein with 4Fe4S-binding SPASM domain
LKTTNQTAIQATALLPRVPVSCFWEITEACNLRCTHCEANAATAAPDELDTSEALAVVDELAELGCENLFLTGGEPLMRKDWALIAQAAVAHKLCVSVISNGVLVTATTIAAMQDAGVFGVSISLDGLREAHDRIRLPVHGSTASSFDSAMRAIQLAVASPLNTAVITLVHRNNIAQLPALHDLLSAAGVRVWQVQICMPLGRMRHRQAEMLIAPREIPELEAVLAELIEAGKLRIAVGDNIGYYGRQEPTLRGSVRGIKSFWMGCFAGCRIVALGANGDVKGCPSHPRELVCGNIRQTPLAEIWNDESRFGYNTAWQATQITGDCAQCPHQGLCRAGCTTMALATSGSIYDNPYCSLRALPDELPNALSQ